MKPFPAKYLNQTADIKRPNQTQTDSGDLTRTLDVAISGVKIRIVDNDREVTYGRTIEQGHLVNCTHHGFLLPGIAVQKGDIICITGKSDYKVMYVELDPGGESNHHIEIYLERVE